MGRPTTRWISTSTRTKLGRPTATRLWWTRAIRSSCSTIPRSTTRSSRWRLWSSTSLRQRSWIRAVLNTIIFYCIKIDYNNFVFIIACYKLLVCTNHYSYAKRALLLSSLSDQLELKDVRRRAI